MRKLIVEWSRERGMPVMAPDSFVVRPDITDRHKVLVDHFGEFDFRRNPSVDFGRVWERIPAAVVCPRDVDELAACMQFLADNDIPYKVRAAAMSSGGQSLISGGAVIDTRNLCRIVDDQPEAQQIRVEGGAQWMQLLEHLAPQGRRPINITGNPRSTVAGTLAVGGFGDTTHLIGPQICSVTAITLVTPDGARHQLTPEDELFRYTMAGRGQLGVIADATITTVTKPMVLHVRHVHWDSLESYVGDMTAISGLRLYEFVRAWLSRRPSSPDGYVQALIGSACLDYPKEDRGLAYIRPDVVGPFERLELLTRMREDPSPGWDYACPAMELALPLPHGLDTWRTMYRRLSAAGIAQTFKPGAAVMLTPRTRGLPLAPSPDTEYSLMTVVRPRVDAATANEIVPLIRELTAQAMDAGAKMYLMAVEPESSRFLEQQFGDALPRFRELKSQLDPKGLCNPGLLTPEPAAT